MRLSDGLPFRPARPGPHLTRIKISRTFQLRSGVGSRWCRGGVAVARHTEMAWHWDRPPAASGPLQLQPQFERRWRLPPFTLCARTTGPALSPTHAAKALQSSRRASRILRTLSPPPGQCSISPLAPLPRPAQLGNGVGGGSTPQVRCTLSPSSSRPALGPTLPSPGPLSTRAKIRPPSHREEGPSRIHNFRVDRIVRKLRNGSPLQNKTKNSNNKIK